MGEGDSEQWDSGTQYGSADLLPHCLAVPLDCINTFRKTSYPAHWDRR